jgi:hypothetical protein
MSHPEASALFPADAIARAKHLLSKAGGLGAFFYCLIFCGICLFLLQVRTATALVCPPSVEALSSSYKSGTVCTEMFDLCELMFEMRTAMALRLIRRRSS